jgi:hypothetical protein
VLLPVDPVELIMVAVIAVTAVILYRTVTRPFTRW